MDIALSVKSYDASHHIKDVQHYRIHPSVLQSSLFEVFLIDSVGLIPVKSNNLFLLVRVKQLAGRTIVAYMGTATAEVVKEFAQTMVKLRSVRKE